MGLLADAALSAGGEVIGVMPQQFQAAHIAHRGLTELMMVENWQQRKTTIAEISDGFIALPGGLGVMTELLEMAHLTQIEQHARPLPCGLLNADHYWDPMIAQIEKGIKDGFIRKRGTTVIQHDSEIERLLEKMRRWDPK